MPSELEDRLERLLGSTPRSGAEAERRARQAALDSLGRPQHRRGRAPWLVAAAAVAVVLVMTGVGLAATPGGLPNLRHLLAPARQPAPPPSPAVGHVPRGAAAFATEVGGRIWVATPRGMALRGVRLSAAATSPGALYEVGAAHGRLEAISTGDRHVAWSRPLGGALLGAAWSPYPIRIAYLVGRSTGSRLHVIWGNGAHDQAVDGRVAAVTPAWRSDSLAFAYVSADGAVVMHTIGTDEPSVINAAHACGAQHVTELAFAPHSATLAEATDGPNLILVDTRRPGRISCLATGGQPWQIHWLTRHDLLFSHRQSSSVTRIAIRRRRIIATGSVVVPGTVAGIAPAPDGRGMAVAVWNGSSLRVVVADRPRVGGDAPIRIRQVLSTGRLGGPVAHIVWL